VAVLRRRLREGVALEAPRAQGGQLTFLEMEGGQPYEYAVLVTSLGHGMLTLAQLYRDRADAENCFDELKNQWGWGGFVTRDLTRCQTMARAVALIYNWWTLFARLAQPMSHGEAITTRPLLLHAVGEQTRHGGQRLLRITSTHARGREAQTMLRRLTGILRQAREAAEQLNWAARWRWLLSRIFEKFLAGMPLPAPHLALPVPPNCRI
jgi:hypothetical protein